MKYEIVFESRESSAFHVSIVQLHLLGGQIKSTTQCDPEITDIDTQRLAYQGIYFK